MSLRGLVRRMRSAREASTEQPAERIRVLVPVPEGSPEGPVSAGDLPASDAIERELLRYPALSAPVGSEEYERYMDTVRSFPLAKHEDDHDG